MSNAKGLTKNPLGIIALFISLIYGFACLVLSTGIGNMYGSAERLPLIWFIIIFPVLILVGFIYLVVTNHQKLYAPSDYKDEGNFMKGYQNNKSIPAEQQEMQEENIDGPAIGDLLLKYGSIKGLFGIYAVFLAFKHNVHFTLENLEVHSSILTKDYTQAFLVASVAVGIFDADETGETWRILDIDPVISEKIKDNVYQSAENSKNEFGSTYLYDQLFALEWAFSSASPKNNTIVNDEPDKKPEDGKGIEEAEVVE